jgi:hypothetical protein
MFKTITDLKRISEAANGSFYFINLTTYTRGLSSRSLKSQNGWRFRNIQSLLTRSNTKDYMQKHTKLSVFILPDSGDAGKLSRKRNYEKKSKKQIIFFCFSDKTLDNYKQNWIKTEKSKIIYSISFIRWWKPITLTKRRKIKVEWTLLLYFRS